MIEYEETIVQKPKYIICDKCGKKRDADWDGTFEVYEFIQLESVGGFGSKIGDDVFWELDLCEDCFLELCGDYIRYKETKNDNFVNTKDASESIINRIEDELEKWKTECNIYFKERNKETRRADQLKKERDYWKNMAQEMEKMLHEERQHLYEIEVASMNDFIIRSQVRDDALASELEEVEQKLWDDKKWIESYCDDAEYWKEQAEEARKSWERTTLQRQEVLDQLYELLKATQAYADMSKHLYRECEDTKQLLEKYGEK